MATDAELQTVRGRLFGLIDESRIACVEIGRPDAGVAERYLALTDLCSTVADALDDLGIGGIVAASDLVPRTGSARIAGPAITIRYVREGGNVGARRASGEPARLADRDLYAVGQAGDVAVFDCDGAADASVMGGLSATWAKRLGISGCIVNGAARDLESVKRVGLPLWSRAVTPQTGKHRMRAVEINAGVSLGSASVDPGDFIVGDSSGICVIPRTAIEQTLSLCEVAESTEKAVMEGISSGLPAAALQEIYPADRW